jgi:hypothetical protein
VTQPFKNLHELVHEGLAFDAKEQMLEMVLCEIGRPARIAPQLECGNMWFFLSHNIVGLPLE